MITNLYKNPTRHATWLELFFDLIFVAAIGIVAHDLAHTHNGHISIEQFIKFPLVFIPMWWIWITHTLYANRFDNNSTNDKLHSLVLMGLVVFLAIFSKGILANEFKYFIGAYITIRLFLALLYLKIHSKCKDNINFANDMALAIAIGAIISTSSIFFESDIKYALFYSGILVDMIWQFLLKNKLKQQPLDKVHLIERLGLLSIIILGESMINIVASLSSVEKEFFDIIGAITGFTLICAIWWIYFDSYHLYEKVKKTGIDHLLIFMHLILCIGLLILANLIKHSILGDLDQSTFSMLAMIGLTSFYIGKQVPYMYAFPVWKKAIVINTIVCISITYASTYLPRIEYSLIGMTLGLFFYVYSTFKWVLGVKVDKYLEG